jgi:hypothetical protein
MVTGLQVLILKKMQKAKMLKRDITSKMEINLSLLMSRVGI